MACVYLLTDWQRAYVGRAMDAHKRFHRHPALKRFENPSSVQCHILEFVDDWNETAAYETAWKQDVRQSSLTPVWMTDVEWPMSLEITRKNGCRLVEWNKAHPESLRVGGHVTGRMMAESGQIQALGHIYGPIRGRQAVESGQLESVRNLPQTKTAQREAGRSIPREAKIRGGRIGGRIGGRRVHELYPEMFREIGRISGRKSVVSGHWARARAIITPEQHSEYSRIAGRIAVESGQLAKAAALVTPEMRRKNGRKSGRKNVENGHIYKLGHIRWHVNRGIVNPNCELCQKRTL